MRHTSKIIRFEEHFDSEGTVANIFMACTLMCDEAPATVDPDGSVVPQSRYYEHWFTPDQVVAYNGHTNRAAYVQEVIAGISPMVCEAWLAEISTRAPAPRRLSLKEIQTEMAGGEVTVSD